MSVKTLVAVKVTTFMSTSRKLKRKIQILHGAIDVFTLVDTDGIKLISKSDVICSGAHIRPIDAAIPLILEIIPDKSIFSQLSNKANNTWRS